MKTDLTAAARVVPLTALEGRGAGGGVGRKSSLADSGR
jgi:hypothetical protein